MAGRSYQDEGETRIRNPPFYTRAPDHQISDADFTCNCCFELMVDPTTLNCGHNLCRLCLAKWFLQSRRRTCPSCQQEWQGHPKVNLTLRSTMQKLFPERFSERKEETDSDPENARTISQFDKEIGRANNVRQFTRVIQQGLNLGGGNVAPARQNGGDNNTLNYCAGMCVFLVAWLIWYWLGGTSSTPLIKKTVNRWSALDATTWVAELGPWAEDNYAMSFLEKKIDGSLLLSLTEEDLGPMFNMTLPLHRRTFLLSLEQLKIHGTKPPKDLWEFKALYPGNTLLLMYASRDFPRTAILYLYFFEYRDIFLHFLHATCPEEDGDLYVLKLPDPSYAQWVEFLVKTVVFPYYLIGQFAAGYMTINYWASRFVMAICLLLTITEAMLVQITYMLHCSNVRGKIWDYVKHVFTLCAFVLFWPIIPNLICEFVFYTGLFFTPLSYVQSIKESFLYIQGLYARRDGV